MFSVSSLIDMSFFIIYTNIVFSLPLPIFVPLMWINSLSSEHDQNISSISLSLSLSLFFLSISATLFLSEYFYFKSYSFVYSYLSILTFSFPLHLYAPLSIRYHKA